MPYFVPLADFPGRNDAVPAEYGGSTCVGWYYVPVRGAERRQVPQVPQVPIPRQNPNRSENAESAAPDVPANPQNAQNPAVLDAIAALSRLGLRASAEKLVRQVAKPGMDAAAIITAALRTR